MSFVSPTPNSILRQFTSISTVSFNFFSSSQVQEFRNFKCTHTHTYKSCILLLTRRCQSTIIKVYTTIPPPHVCSFFCWVREREKRKMATLINNLLFSSQFNSTQLSNSSKTQERFVVVDCLLLLLRSTLRWDGGDTLLLMLLWYLRYLSLSLLLYLQCVCVFKPSISSLYYYWPPCCV